jgi:hypothetical protein
MTPEQYITENYGEEWLVKEWNSGDVLEALEGYRNFKEPTPAKPPLPTISDIVNAVALFHDIEPHLMTVKRRKREIVEPRQLIFALLMFGLRIPCEKVGELMGKFHHCTVLYGIGQVSSRYQTYTHYRIAVNQLIESLFPDPITQKRIIDRIIDPHLDRKEGMYIFGVTRSLVACV